MQSEDWMGKETQYDIWFQSNKPFTHDPRYVLTTQPIYNVCMYIIANMVGSFIRHSIRMYVRNKKSCTLIPYYDHTINTMWTII